VVLGTATAATEEALLGTADSTETADAGEEATGPGPEGVPAAVEALMVVTTGLRVDEVTVERAGQLVTEAAHEVMVTHSVEKTVDEESSSGSTTAAAEVTEGAAVVASAATDDEEVVAALAIWKGLEYWKISALSP
jgi:hypothetical protein